MRDVLIGGGFISSHLQKLLINKGLEYKLIHHDEELDAEEYDTVFYLAAYGNLYSQENESTMLQANVYDLHEALKCLNYHKFIHISTSSVTLPIQTMYSASKAAAEKICEAYAQTYHKEIISIRPYTVIGTKEPESHLIPQLISHAYSGEAMPFVPDAYHDFTNVDDLNDAIFTLSNSPIDKWQAVGVGSGQETSNQEVKSIVEEITGRNIKTVLTSNLRPYDNKNWYCRTGWMTKTSLADTIKEMVDDYQETVLAAKP